MALRENDLSTFSIKNSSEEVQKVEKKVLGITFLTCCVFVYKFFKTSAIKIIDLTWKVEQHLFIFNKINLWKVSLIQYVDDPSKEV